MIVVLKPDISKRDEQAVLREIKKLGYKPQVSLAQGLPPTLDWYWAHENLAPQAD